MKKLCAITGFPLTISSHFSNYFTRSLHPLLEVRTDKLLELAGSKSWMEWQDEEAKLLFLAIANSLGLLKVVEPAIAKPTPQVIASSIEMLVAIAGWHSVRNFPLPCLCIAASDDEVESNEKMLTFPALLTTVIATRDETLEGDKLAIEAIHLEEAIKILYAKCSIGANKTKMLRTKAADWALKITLPSLKEERVTKEMQEQWHKMLTTAPVDAHKFEDMEIQELDEFMSCNLPHGCTASYEVMKHLTAMKQATIGLVAFLGIDNVIKVIEQAPKDAPIESNFPTKLSFLIAKAKWQQAASARASSKSTSISYQEVPMQELPIIDSFEEAFDEALEENEGGNDDSI